MRSRLAGAVALAAAVAVAGWVVFAPTPGEPQLPGGESPDLANVPLPPPSPMCEAWAQVESLSAAVLPAHPDGLVLPDPGAFDESTGTMFDALGRTLVAAEEDPEVPTPVVEAVNGYGVVVEMLASRVFEAAGAGEDLGFDFDRASRSTLAWVVDALELDEFSDAERSQYVETRDVVVRHCLPESGDDYPVDLEAPLGPAEGEERVPGDDAPAPEEPPALGELTSSAPPEPPGGEPPAP